MVALLVSSNRDPQEAVAGGHLCQDLYYSSQASMLLVQALCEPTSFWRSCKEPQTQKQEADKKTRSDETNAELAKPGSVSRAEAINGTRKKN